MTKQKYHNVKKSHSKHESDNRMSYKTKRTLAFVAFLVILIGTVTGVVVSNSSNTTTESSSSSSSSSKSSSTSTVSDSSAYSSDDYTSETYSSGSSSSSSGDDYTTQVQTSAPTSKPTAKPTSSTSTSTSAPTTPTSKPTAYPTINPSDVTVVDLTNSKTHSDVEFRVVNTESALGYSPYLEQGNVSDFGRFKLSDYGYLRTLVPDFKDITYSMIGYPESTDNTISDDDYWAYFVNKMALWSNYTYSIKNNGDYGFKRYTLAKKSSFKGKCVSVRKKLLTLAKKDNTNFVSNKSTQHYFAAICYIGAGNGAVIQLANGSLPSYFHEYGHLLQWNHNHLFQRLDDGRWGQLAEYGDHFSCSGGMELSRGIDHYGPEGYTPAQKHAFGWFDEDDYINLVPGNTYRLRTVWENTIVNSSYPMALFYRDLVYDSESWFSFYRYPKVFSSTYEEDQGDNAHGDGMGFVFHVASGNTKSKPRNHATQITTFGKNYTHHNGLRFETVDFNRDYVDVRVTYDKADQTTWVPQYNIYQTKIKSGSSTRYAQTTVTAKLQRNYDEYTIDPFSIDNYATVVCDWGTYTNGVEGLPSMIGPGLKSGGSVLLYKKPVTTNMEHQTISVTVSYSSK